MSQFTNPLQRFSIRPVTAGMFLLLIALLIAMVGASATAQENNTPDAQPTPLNGDDIIAASHEFKILSITEDGDQRKLEIEIPVTQDTFTASGQPNTNFGLDASLRIGYNADPPTVYGAMRTFLQWDVASFIPSNAIINSAIFQMWVSGATPAGDPPMAVLGRHLADPWSATTLTWNSTQPNWGSEIGTGSIPSTIGMIQGDITGLVRDWVSGANPNYGVMLQGDETQRERQRVLYSQNAGNGLYPRLIVDFTVSNDTTPPYASVNGLPVYSKNPFVVSWTGHDNEGSDPNATGIAYYQVQYNVGGGSWVEWINQTTNTSAEFGSGANNETYQFRVRAVDRAGNVQSWDNTPVTQTKVDTVPPNVTMNSLPEYTFSNTIDLSWTGSDNPGGSGIAYYDVQYIENETVWTTLLSNYTGTTYTATGASNGATYGFRVRGVDNVGNEQPWSSVPQAETTVVNQPIAIVNQFDPLFIQPGNPDPTQVRVTWQAWTPPGTAIVFYTLYYRVNNGAWVELTQTSSQSYDFVFPSTDNAEYDFEVTATNNANQTDPFNGQTEAWVIYNMNPPYIEIQSHLPAVFSND